MGVEMGCLIIARLIVDLHTNLEQISGGLKIGLKSIDKLISITYTYFCKMKYGTHRKFSNLIVT
jgi:hypothetical protein